MKVYVVWNAKAKEGLVFDNEKDARDALHNQFNYPAIADSFRDSYPDGNMIFGAEIEQPKARGQR